MIYKFTTGHTYRGVDAQTVGDELERIRNASGGKLEASEVVRWAAEPDSPIHDTLTWDDEKAAHEYRLQEVRQLIRSVVVVTDAETVPQPAYWNVSVAVPSPEPGEPTTEQYYQSSEVVARNPQEFDAALKVMLRELASAERGLEQLRRLAPRGTRTAITRATGQVKSAQLELTPLVPNEN